MPGCSTHVTIMVSLVCLYRPVGRPCLDLKLPSVGWVGGGEEACHGRQGRESWGQGTCSVVVGRGGDGRDRDAAGVGWSLGREGRGRGCKMNGISPINCHCAFFWGHHVQRG